MRRIVLAGLAAGLCAVFGSAETAAALQLSTSIDLDYTYAQVSVGDEVNAATTFNQSYEIRYETSLTTAYDFLGAVRLVLQDAWFTDGATTSGVAPTLEMSTKGSQASAKIAYEATINSTDAFHESGDVTSYADSLSFDLNVTPQLWPEMKLNYQRRRDYQESTKESTVSSYQFSALKDIYNLRLEYNFQRTDTDTILPEQLESSATTWSAKATYKEILWGGTQFELAYELNETYEDDQTGSILPGETSSYNQILKTRLKNSLDIGPQMTLGLSWEYQFEQDLLALDYDYKLINNYGLDLRWDAFDWFKIVGAVKRETSLTALPGEDDQRTMTDTLTAGFDMTRISWLRVSGKAMLKSGGAIAAGTGGSEDKTEEEKYELVANNRIGEFWDLTCTATTTTNHVDGWLTHRDTDFKADLKLRWLDLVVSPVYEISRTNEWEQAADFPTSQQQVQDARIRFEYQMQLADLFKATFSHEYGIKVEDNLDEVLNFEEQTQFNEDTRLSFALPEIVRDLSLEGEIERKASDTEGDPDPELIEVSYAFKLNWILEQLSVLSTIKYNDKGDTFDDVSFNAQASWRGEQLSLTAEYQFDKIIKDITEPKDEKRKLSLKLNYKF